MRGKSAGDRQCTRHHGGSSIGAHRSLAPGCSGARFPPQTGPKQSGEGAISYLGLGGHEKGVVQAANDVFFLCSKVASFGAIRWSSGRLEGQKRNNQLQVVLLDWLIGHGWQRLGVTITSPSRTRLASSGFSDCNTLIFTRK
jgi:hypothetical protein